MTKKTYLLILISLLFSLNKSFSQGVAVGKWRDHLPYRQGTKVVVGNNMVYCITTAGMFSYNKSDNSIEKMSKINGLSDVDVTAAEYSKTHDLLIIGYVNGNIDIIEGSVIYNLSHIKNKEMTGVKTINNIIIIDNLAFLSCGFGIVVLDFLRHEIKDTYLIGPNGDILTINEIAYDGTYLFAATEKGIYKGEKDNPNLIDFSEWECITNVATGQACVWVKDKSFNTIAFFNNKIYANYSSGSWGKDSIMTYYEAKWHTFKNIATNLHCLKNSNNSLLSVSVWGIDEYDSNENIKNSFFSNNIAINPYWAIFDENNVLWVADNTNGLVKMPNTLSGEIIHPQGPSKSNVVSMSSSGNNLWVASGAKDGSWKPTYHQGEVYSFINEQWKTTIVSNPTANDIVSIAVNPINPNQVFAGSVGYGVVEFRNNDFYKIYNGTNSTLQTWDGILNDFRIFGLTFDKAGNLWVANSGKVAAPFSIMTPAGKWYSLPYKSAVDINEISSIIVTINNHKWVILPRGVGLFAFDEKGTFENTSDDNKIKFGVNDENGKTISNDIFSIAEDLKGTIWVGTNKGVVAYYNPENVFSGSNFYAQQIKVPSEIAGQANYLLETDIVTAIAVDGSNKKWFGTESSGVFLMSEDCTSQIYHFTTENSPLISNTITSIAIDGISGEIFFGTNKGIISFRGTATDGAETFDEILVFPNPVKPDYAGLITVKGLVTNSNVKITDISGNIVFETKAEGGQAIWNGKDFRGDKVHTGVYLVFSTNEDGSKTNVSKILFIN